MTRATMIFFLIAKCINMYAGGCPIRSELTINSRQVFNVFPDIHLSHTWAGKCYVDTTYGYATISGAYLVFMRGDTIFLIDNNIITEPGTYHFQPLYCDRNQSYFNDIVCSYLPDSLELYYKYHFVPKFMDSMATIEKAFDDSVAAVPATFYPNPVQDKVTFECFKTVQEPFDFSAYDLQGRCILTRRVEFTDSYQTQTIDVSSLESGTYIIKYFINEKPYTRQILKL